MATVTLWPVSAAVVSDWDTSPWEEYHWPNVDDGFPHDGDSTYIYEKNFAIEDERNCLFNPESHSIPSGATINKVTVGIYAKNTGSGGPQITIKIRLSGTDSESSNISAVINTYTEYTEDFTTKPGGGSWAVTDIENIDFGVYLALAAKVYHVKVTACWMIVDYTEDTPTVHTLGIPCAVNSETREGVAGTLPFFTGGTPYAAKSLETDRETNPTNASDDPLFTAIVDFENDLRTAEYAQIQIGSLRYGSDIWDSGWLAITSTADGNRCQEISYSGSTVLGSGRTYYVRMRFKDNLGNAGAWSPELATFAGTVSAWWDVNYIFREKVRWPSHHDAIGSGDMCVFEHKTGLREIVAENGFFNEGVDFARHSILNHKGYRHIVYLSQLDKSGASPDLDIMIVTRDPFTGLWGTPVKIGDSGTNFDTHYFASICVTPNDDKLHVFGGCHNTKLKYWRSVNANDSSSWESEVDLGGMVSYPHCFTLPNNRIYVFARGTSGLDNLKASFIYSTNGGSTWSAWLPFCVNNLTDAARVYLFGVRVDYDHIPIRLHIVIDFTVLPTGEEGHTAMSQYAYSDYDDLEDEGFHDWYTHNDALTGITGNVSGYIRHWDNDPVYTEDVIWEVTYGARDAKGCTYCYLDSNRSPQMILGSGPWGGDRWHGGIGIAKIDGTGWSINWFTKALDIDLWHGRQGAVAMVDENDTIHIFAIVCPKRYSINLPTGNGNYTQWDKSDSGKELYEHVDDDRYDLDESIYLTSTVEAEKCSFTFSFDLPDNVKILAVDVSYFARRVGSGSPTVKPFLRIGSTDYEAATAQATDGYYFSQDWPSTGHGEYHQSWDTNPATSAAWVEANLTGLQVGLKYHDDAGASQTMHLARIQCRVLIMQAGHEKWFAGELVEFLSPDNGVTWSYHLLTGNSAFGLPILNMKERYTNRQIELMYVCGNDILYYHPKTWGMMQIDGRDCRLVYNGTEIDRIPLDYFNLKSTQLAFAAPEAIAAHAQHPPKNLYLYHGNPHAGIAKSNPDNVLDFYEGFETYAHGSSIDGVNGWSLTTGTATVYQASRWIGSALYNHNNKVCAGLQALKFSTTCTVERTVGTNVTNIEIAVSAWMETANGTRCYMEVEDNEGNIFAVGLYGAQDCGLYYDGSWHNSTVKGTPNNQYRLKIRVTPSGVSAWFRDEQIVTNNQVLNSVTTLRLRTEAAESYFDHIQVYKYIETPGTIGFDGTEYHGCYSDATIVGRGKLQNISDAKIDGYRRFMAGGFPISTGGEKDNVQILPHNNRLIGRIPGMLPADSGQARDLNLTLAASTEKLLRNVALLPIDSGMSAALAEPMNLNAGSQKESSVVLPASSEIHQIYDLVLPTATEKGASLPVMLPVASRQQLRIDGWLGVNAGRHLQSAIILGIESLVGSGISALLPVSSSTGHDIAILLPSGTTMRFLSSQWMQPVDSMLGSSLASLLGCEMLLGYDIHVLLPIYTMGGVDLDCAIILPFDTLERRVVPAMVPIHTRQRLATVATLPINQARISKVQTVFPVETSLHKAIQVLMAVESSQQKRVQALLGVAAEHDLRLDQLLGVNSRERQSVFAILPANTSLANSLAGILGTENLQGSQLPTVQVFSSMLANQLYAILHFNTLGSLVYESAIILPVASGQRHDQSVVAPVNTNALNELQTVYPVDQVRRLIQAAPLSVDAGSLRVSSLILPTATVTQRVLDSILSNSSSLAVTVQAILPFNSLGIESLDVGIILPINTMEKHALPSHLPVDTRQQVKIAVQAMVDAGRLLGIDVVCPQYARQEQRLEAVQSISTLAQRLSSCPLSHESQRQIITSVQLIAASSQRMNVQATISVHTRKDQHLDLVMHIESIKGQAAMAVVLPFENLRGMAIQWMLPFYDAGHVAIILALTQLDHGKYRVETKGRGGYQIVFGDSVGYRIKVIAISDGEGE